MARPQERILQVILRNNSYKLCSIHHSYGVTRVCECLYVPHLYQLTD
jgi:hypothetical protein